MIFKDLAPSQPNQSRVEKVENHFIIIKWKIETPQISSIEIRTKGRVLLMSMSNDELEGGGVPAVH